MTPRSSAADLLRSPEATAALLAMVAVGVASGAIQFLMPLQLGRAGHSASAIGGVLCAAGLVYVVSSTTMTRSRETGVTTFAVVVGCVAIGVLILPAALAPHSTEVLVGCLLFFTVPRAVLNTLAYRLASRSTAAVSGNIGFVVGSLNLMWSAAASAGPLGAGWLDDRFGARAGFLGTAVASIGVGLLLVRLTRFRSLPGAPATELSASACDTPRGGGLSGPEVAN
jgi:predicted MFS family arabinose efflux permease